MKKMLIALDGSQDSMRAVSYVADNFAVIADLRITLLHVLSEMPTGLWEEGHLLDENEKFARQETRDKWLNNQERKIQPSFQSALDLLVKAGLSPDQVETRAVPGSLNVAETILTDAKNIGCQTIVLGRRGLSGISRFLMGSVTTKVVNHGKGMAICVVE